MSNMPPKFNHILSTYGKVPKPILMNTEMTKATLDEIKRMTRRVVGIKDNTLKFTGQIVASTNKKKEGLLAFGKTKEVDVEYAKPQYQKGDILYVRETFKIGAWQTEYHDNCTASFKVAIDYKADKPQKTPWVYISQQKE